MRRLLLIESSPTMRRGIERLLVDGGDAVHAVPADAQALAVLDGELAQGLAAVLLGWAGTPAAVAAALVQRLARPDARGVALLVLGAPNAPAVPPALAARPHTGVFSPAAPQEVPELLRGLLAPVAPSGREHLRVLLVDDSRTSRTKYRRLLQSQGWQVTACDGPQQALERVGSASFDLAIIDYYMPGMSGADLCRRLRGQPDTCELPLAILTASYADTLIEDCLAAGASECMFKDESNALFLARVRGMARLRERELRLHDERQRLALILESVGDGLYGVDPVGRITFANGAALRMLGCPREADLVGAAAHRAIHPVDVQGRPVATEASFLQQAYELGDSLSDWETVFRRSDGTLLDVECSVRPQFQGGRCTGSVVAFRDITERKRFEADLLWQLQHDHLTGLHNRRHFEQVLEQELLRLRRSPERSALLFIDLDRFKQINDTAGHAAGDALLVAIGRRLQARARASDVVARLAGDEFAVLLRQVDEPALLALAESFRAILDDHHFNHGGHEFEVSGSVGAVELGRDSESAAQALACADAACRLAKQHGRNRIHRYDPRHDAQAASALQQSWSQRLARALGQGGLALQYQSIVPLQALAGQAALPGPLALARRRPAGTRPAREVFLRLRDTDMPLRPPAFLPQAERFNLLPRLDAWVLARVAEQLDRPGPAATFHVNVAAVSLLDLGYLAELERLLRQPDFRPGCLLLELKDSDIAPQLAQLLPVLQRLASLGLQFVLDEFGRGYSALQHLRTLPLCAVKLDAGLVSALGRDAFAVTLVRTMIDLAHSLGLQVYAPAVEDLATLRQVQALGGDHAQGFLLGNLRDAADTAPATLAPLA